MRIILLSGSTLTRSMASTRGNFMQYHLNTGYAQTALIGKLPIGARTEQGNGNRALSSILKQGEEAIFQAEGIMIRIRPVWGEYRVIIVRRSITYDGMNRWLKVYGLLTELGVSLETGWEVFRVY